MPQLSPMSWVLVIMVFLVCLICFAVMVWWEIEGKYAMKCVKSGSKFVGGNKPMKWGFGSTLSK
uniref:ATP synthase F0 subunit 8 n=1 Tax=Lanceolaria lanceolata TaxID=2508263 RepID=X2G665_LANLA|nr:ATP synthase F0 subunit 8 [Lanceolaria lanceolata]AHN13439.1 ATP synthase F0 subunit 8 [Lanceolaria lanceolata]